MPERDAVQADPQHYTVELENDQVRVLRTRYGPGEKSVPHAHPPHLAIFLTDAHMRFNDQAGGPPEAQTKAGQVVQLPAWSAGRGDPRRAEEVGPPLSQGADKRRHDGSQNSNRPASAGLFFCPVHRAMPELPTAARICEPGAGTAGTGSSVTRQAAVRVTPAPASRHRARAERHGYVPHGRRGR
jgi:hypothetical protein